jgi:hypothetical protein
MSSYLICSSDKRGLDNMYDVLGSNFIDFILNKLM